MKMLTRRGFAAGAAMLPVLSASGVVRAAEPDLTGLRNIASSATPIGPDERRARIARAQALMKAQGI
ncbi:hypothetical protein ABTM26_19480, partial [Acinetobacter baumannii]